MTEDPLVSVIVPVYKIEYLERCIESILGQTYHNLEVILVDDESPYGAGQICDAYAKQDNRVHVIHKKMAEPALPEMPDWMFVQGK